MSAPAALILGCAGPRLDRDEAAFLADANPWGFILFARNVESPAQISALVEDLRAAVGRRAPVLIDQEGGRVARLGPPFWTGWPDAGTHMAAIPPDRRAEAMRRRYRVIGAELAALGIDVNCAPMADLARPDTNAALAPRMYGGDPAEVAALGRAVADGLTEAGVLPVLKHIPGHGRTPLDSHVALPRVAADLDTLERADFAPFRALADLALGMTAHVVYEALDPERPATLSPVVIRAIRGGIGFDGLLMSDDISMGALSGPLAERAGAAIAAGCDVVLHCNGDRAEMAALAGAVPRLSGAALRRADAALAARDALSGDVPDVPGELAALAALAGPERRHA